MLINYFEMLNLMKISLACHEHVITEVEKSSIKYKRHVITYNGKMYTNFTCAKSKSIQYV